MEFDDNLDDFEAQLHRQLEQKKIQMQPIDIVGIVVYVCVCMCVYIHVPVCVRVYVCVCGMSVRVYR